VFECRSFGSFRLDFSPDARLAGRCRWAGRRLGPEETIQLDTSERETVAADLPNGTTVRVEVLIPPGEEEVGAHHFQFREVANAVRELAQEFVQIGQALRPDKLTVELNLGVSVQAGKLTALLLTTDVRSGIRVGIEWTRPQPHHDNEPPAATG
jgi:hypothetical protein